MWVALFINCATGTFKPVGPFEHEDDAEQWVFDNAVDPRMWEAIEVQNPVDPPNLSTTGE